MGMGAMRRWSCEDRVGADIPLDLGNKNHGRRLREWVMSGALSRSGGLV